MKNIPLGRYSAYLAALVWLGLGVGVVATRLTGPYFFKEGGVYLTCWFFGGLGMALLGVGLAIGGLMQADRKKWLALLGLVLNGVVFLSGSWVLYFLIQS